MTLTNNILTVFLLSFFLVGCGGGSSSSQDGNQKAYNGNSSSGDNKGGDTAKNTTDPVLQKYGISNPSNMQKEILDFINEFRSHDRQCGGYGYKDATHPLKYSELLNIVAETVATRVRDENLTEKNRDWITRRVNHDIWNEEERKLGSSKTDIHGWIIAPDGFDWDSMLNDLKKLENPQTVSEDRQCAILMAPEYNVIGYRTVLKVEDNQNKVIPALLFSE